MDKYIGSLNIKELKKIDTKLADKVQDKVNKFKDNKASFWIDVMVNENDDIVLVSDNGLECSTDIKINKKLIDSIVKAAVEV